MSSRKENIYNKTSATKSSASKRYQPLQAKCGPVNLNSTFANMPPPHRRLKPELSVTIIHTPFVDYDLQYDVAYSNYLHALLFQQYSRNKIKEHSLSMEDQLSKYTDILFKKLDVVDELEHRIKEHGVQIVIQNVLPNLESKVNRNLKEFPSDIAERLSIILGQLEYVRNHLYVDNVKTLKSQEEYCNLQLLLAKCNENLLKIINVVGDTAKYQNLNNCLSDFKNTCEEIGAIESLIKTTQSNISKLALENISDILFENNNTIVKDVNV